MAKPDATKPTSDTPVSPAEAVDFLHGTVKAVQNKVRPQVPNYDEGAVELSDARAIRNGALTRVSTTLTTPSIEPGKNEKTGFSIRGHEDAVSQKREPTTITETAPGGKSTTYALGRDDAGKISATQVLTPEEQAAGVQPKSLGQSIVGKLKGVPSAHFTQEGQKAVRDTALTTENAVDERNRVHDARVAQEKKVLAEGGLPKGVVDQHMVEQPGAADARVAQVKAAEAASTDRAGIKVADGSKGGWQVGKNFGGQRRGGPGQSI